MAAYAALVTLSKAIHQLLPYVQHYSFLCPEHQMQSLRDKVISFQVFLEDVSRKSSDGIDELESRIRDVAYRLEDIVESILVHSLAMEYQDEVNSSLSIQEAASHFSIGEATSQLSSLDQECENEVNSQLLIQEVKSEVISPIGKADTQLCIGEANSQLPLAAGGRAKSRKSFFRRLAYKLCVPCCRRSTIKDGSGSAEASTSIISVSAQSETETSLDDILGWCLDQDIENKAKYSHLPLIARAAAVFGNCIKEADLLFEEATETRKKALDNNLVISGTSILPHDIATSLSRGPPDANDTMVGLKDDLQQILDQINRRQRALEVIPITGMGGIGKTTLARAVYDHHGKQAHFDLVLWATVSQQYNVKEILRVLCPENTGSDAIVSVHKRLKGRRYLIILDDVWDEKLWDGVRIAFPDDTNGSRVILTTRLSKVATYVSSSSTHAHQMQLLNEEQSWNLLRETVYGHEIGCPSKFEYFIGRRISGNCKGLPLALVVIGGLLKLNNAEDHWEHVATSTTAEAAADDDSLLRILSLSYSNLPPHLKACFLYIGMFPEDKEIPTKELVCLWCAEGFLKPRESKTMEEVGEECLEELAERNLILVKKKRYNGKIKTSSIHDVLRDLSLIQAEKEKFHYCHDGSSEIDRDTFLRIIKDQPRRVSFQQFNLDSSILYDSPIRTFRITDQRSGMTMIPEFKLVRVLGEVRFSPSAVINSVRLNNLRYLHLYKGDCDNESIIVPKSISKLRNLETIFVTYPFSSDEYDLILRVEIWEMPRLRHLVSEGVNIQLLPFSASSLVSSIESWSLQTLSVVNFGDFSPRVIQKLQQNLKKLKIKYKKISRGDKHKVFGLENLVNLHHLEHLTISSESISPFYDDAPRVRNIGFPINLKKLSLKYTELPWEKMTAIGDLIHLEVLKLYRNAFLGTVWEPTEGGFPQLKYLKMEKLRDLEEWRAESTHFPSLEKLVILECEYLKEVPAEIGDIDTLEKLIVKRDYFMFSNKSAGDSFEESVGRIEEEQQRVGNHSLQVIIMSRDQYFKKGEISSKDRRGTTESW